MKKAKLIRLNLLYPLVATLGLATFSAQAEVIYSNGFDGLPLGNASDRDIKNTWSTRYAKGPDEGRVTTVTDSHTGKAIRIKYPANANQSSPSGATWEKIGRAHV